MFTEDEAHAELRCPEILRLAQFHWYLLKSSKLMESLCFDFVDKQEGGLKLRSVNSTEFGEEVGRDEIDWWINRKEGDLTAFEKESTAALDAAQTLKQAAAELKKLDPESYTELLAELRTFAEQHGAEIDALCNYVRWLYSRDILAPSILFTYKVWGTTRMSDRIAEVTESAGAPEEESPDMMSMLSEIVLGIWARGLRKFDQAHMEVGYEVYDQYAGREQINDREIEIPARRVLRRATRMITDECATYFSFIRDSLRDILNEIAKRQSRENLIGSDSFWRSFVEKAIACRKVETQLWDFKETLSMWHAPDGETRRRAKVEFAEDLASFANADGGCLIIGVSNTREIVGFADSERDSENRIKTAYDALAHHLQYPRTIFRIQQVLIRNSEGNEKLCLVVVIARACEPVGVNDGEGRYSYPVRHGTGKVRGDVDKLGQARIHDKSDDFEFMKQLSQFVRDN